MGLIKFWVKDFPLGHQTVVEVESGNLVETHRSYGSPGLVMRNPRNSPQALAHNPANIDLEPSSSNYPLPQWFFPCKPANRFPSQVWPASTAKVRLLYIR
jgi:hypothetical protein